MAPDSFCPVCTFIVIAKVYLVFIIVIIPQWFIVINGNIVKHATTKVQTLSLGPFESVIEKR